MQIVIANPVKYLGIHYVAGSQTVADGLAADLINLGVAKPAVPVPAIVPVMGSIDPLTGGIKTLAVLTQAQYDALAVKDEFTEYNIVTA